MRVMRVCDKFVGGRALSHGTTLPELFPLSAQVQATQGDNGIGATNGPLHARLFEPETDDGFAAGFHHPRSHEQPLPAEICVTHALSVVLKIVPFPINLPLYLFVWGFQFEDSPNGFLHLVGVEFLITSLVPGFPFGMGRSINQLGQFS